MRTSAVTLAAWAASVTVASAAFAGQIPITLTTTHDSARGVTLVATPVDGVGPSATARLKTAEVRAGGDEPGREFFAEGADAVGHAYPVTIRLLAADGKVLVEAGPFAVPVTKEAAKGKGNVATGWDLEQNRKGRIAIVAGSHLLTDQFSPGHVRTPYTVQVDVSGPALANLGSAVEVLIGDSTEPGAPKVVDPYVLMPLDDLDFTFAGALDFGKAEPKGAEYDVVASWEGEEGQPLGQPELMREKAKGQKVKGTVAYQYQPWDLESDVGEVAGVTYALTALRIADNMDAQRSRLRYDVTPLDGGPALDPALQPLVPTGTVGGEAAVVADKPIADKDTWVFLATPLDAAGKAMGKAVTLTANTAAAQNVLVGGSSSKVGGGSVVVHGGSILTSDGSTITVGDSSRLVASGFAAGTASLQLELMAEKSTGPALQAWCGEKACATKSILVPLTPTLERVPMLFDQAGEAAVTAATELKPGYTWMFWITPRSAKGVALSAPGVLTMPADGGAEPQFSYTGPGTFKCKCRPGYKGNGVSCAVVCDSTSAMEAAFVSLEPIAGKTDGPALTMTQPNPLGAKDAIWVPLKTTRTTMVAEPTLFAGAASIAGVEPTRTLVAGDHVAFVVRLSKSEPTYYVSHAADHGARVMLVARDLSGPRVIRLAEREGGLQDGDIVDLEAMAIGNSGAVRLKSKYKTRCNIMIASGDCLYGKPLPMPGTGGLAFTVEYDSLTKTMDLGSLLAEGGVTGLQLQPVLQAYDVALTSPTCKDAACTGGLAVTLAASSVGYTSNFTLRYPTGTDSNATFAYALKFTGTTNFVDDWQGETGYVSLQPRRGGICQRGRCYCDPGYCGSGDERVVTSGGNLLAKCMHAEEN
jgi:hypothetical protein